MNVEASLRIASRPDNIISYVEMCTREGSSLQRGMNFGLGKTYSVILMSLHPNAPYQDRIEDNGLTLVYEGHDVPKTKVNPNPKIIDQPELTPKGSLTENGKFAKAVRDYKSGTRLPEIVRAYQKILPGIWSLNGDFNLVDCWKEVSNNRLVFKFKLTLTSTTEGMEVGISSQSPSRQRIIPTSVKLAVWKRDHGKCVICGATDELHFDHILPFSKGGTSLTSENVQLLCARHNLEKSNKLV